MSRPSVVKLPGDLDDEGPLDIANYQRMVRSTDKLKLDDLSTPTLGLFGEVGSLLAALKKKRRDSAAYSTYPDEIAEEWGDALWYLTALVNRADQDLAVVAQRGFRVREDWDEVEPEFGCWSDLSTSQTATEDDVADSMEALAVAAGELVGHLHTRRLHTNRDVLSGDLVGLLAALVRVANAAGVDMDSAARENLRKALSRFAEEEEKVYPPPVDSDMPDHERLPPQLKILVKEHEVAGKTYVLQTCNGIIIGDRLTDNRPQKDDYRFHDVFHLAYAVHLGWSPVLRALLHLKRKSRPELDEGEDGARAVLIEEGVATLVFGRARDRNFYDGVDRLDYDTLKLVQEFVRGYEPEACALWQWERAILDGFAVFRKLVSHRRGWVIADLEAHTLSFEPAEEKAREGEPIN